MDSIIWLITIRLQSIYAFKRILGLESLVAVEDAGSAVLLSGIVVLLSIIKLDFRVKPSLFGHYFDFFPQEIR